MSFGAALCPPLSEEELVKELRENLEKRLDEIDINIKNLQVRLGRLDKYNSEEYAKTKKEKLKAFLLRDLVFYMKLKNYLERYKK